MKTFDFFLTFILWSVIFFITSYALFDGLLFSSVDFAYYRNFASYSSSQWIDYFTTLNTGYIPNTCLAILQYSIGSDLALYVSMSILPALIISLSCYYLELIGVKPFTAMLCACSMGLIVFSIYSFGGILKNEFALVFILFALCFLAKKDYWLSLLFFFLVFLTNVSTGVYLLGCAAIYVSLTIRKDLTGLAITALISFFILLLLYIFVNGMLTASIALLDGQWDWYRLPFYMFIFSVMCFVCMNFLPDPIANPSKILICLSLGGLFLSAFIISNGWNMRPTLNSIVFSFLLYAQTIQAVRSALAKKAMIIMVIILLLLLLFFSFQDIMFWKSI